MEYETQYQDDSTMQFECLLFDVDDTLYPQNSGLSTHCTKNIQDFMLEKLGIDENKVADMNSLLYNNYGTTMAGLRATGYAFNCDDYHGFVHGRLPYETLKPDPILRNILIGLPIRKVVFSNGNKTHAAKVLSMLGLEDCFKDIICFETLNSIDSGNIICKPFKEAIELAFKVAGINPHRTLFFDDGARNIEGAKEVGLHTVLVGSSHRVKDADYAIESIHNLREALPELWEVGKRIENVTYSKKIAIEA